MARGGMAANLVDAPGQLRDRRGFEQGSKRDIDPEAIPQPRHDAGRQQRMTAQVEEVVEHADPIDFQHGCPCLDDRGFNGIPRGFVRREDGRATGIDGRQRFAVHLAIRRQGKRFHPHECRRDHVGRESGREPGFQLRRRGMVAPSDDVGHEPAVPLGPPVARHDRDFADLGMRRDRRFDLAQFDAKSADLDLLIGATDILDLAIGAAARQVAGLVEAGARSLRGRVGHETFRGERGRFM